MERCSIGLDNEVMLARIFNTMTLEAEAIRLEGIELGTIYLNPNNRAESACPVCGYLVRSDRPPVENAEDGIAFSWDICPCCNTQYGLDDEFETKPGGLEEAWQALRESWLSKVGQTPEVQKQLQNIGAVKNG